MKTKLLTLLSTLLLASSVHAGLILDTPILGGSILVAETGTVEAQFLGSDAGYFNILFLDTDSTWGEDQIFDKNSKSIDEGTGLPILLNLGHFNAGDELIFRLYVTNTKENFFTGDASRNPDGLPHTLATTTLLQDGSYLTTIGFEDLRGGGDKDYNDFMFSLTNVVDPPARVPEPSVLLLLGCGLAGIYFQRRKARPASARQLI